MANMKMIQATLNDKKFQDLISEKTNWQIKEMQDKKWYSDEIAEVESRISIRSDELRNQLK